VTGGDQVELAETPDLHGAYPRLSTEQVRALERGGRTRSVEADEVLFRAGDVDPDLVVVLSGAVAVLDGAGPDARLLAIHRSHRFVGELGQVTGRPVAVSAVAREPGEVLMVPVDLLRRLVVDDPQLGDLILRALLIRRSLHIELGAGLRIIGSRYSADTRRLREFAARNRLPHRWIDLETDAEADELVRRLGIEPEETPVAIWRGDQVLRKPSDAELAKAIGLRTPVPPHATCDLLVVGAGPAGLAAAVYGASEGLKTLTIDSVAAGGQAGTSPRIENYLGFPAGVSGSDLADRAIIQARKFGAVLSVPARAAALEQADDGCHVVRLDDGTELVGRAVLIATGVRYRRLDVPNLEDYEGVCVFYAATEVEALTCVADPVVVVGGGNSAGQATVFLATRASRVHLLVRGGDLGRDMSRYLVDRVSRTPNVDVRLHTEVRGVEGRDGHLEAVVAEDTSTGVRDRLPAKALFVFIGAVPYAQWLGDELALDEHGFVRTGADAVQGAGRAEGRGTPPYLLETSRRGVFAAGDVRSGSIKRVASAVGEGAMAVRYVHEHLNGARRSGWGHRPRPRPTISFMISLVPP